MAEESPRTCAVVGLGNPGPEYELSPHNIGFLAIDRLAERYGVRVNRRKCRALVGEGVIEGTPVLLAKPQTYMNLSGNAVQPLLAMHNLRPENLVLIYDEHDLPWGSLRIRARGSAGGHHGVESVITCLGTNEFVRVRVGIDPGQGRADPEYLLSSMRREQRKELDEILDQTVQAVVSIISEGVEKSMTRFNRRARGKTIEEG